MRMLYDADGTVRPDPFAPEDWAAAEELGRLVKKACEGGPLQVMDDDGLECHAHKAGYFEIRLRPRLLTPDKLSGDEEPK